MPLLVKAAQAVGVIGSPEEMAITAPSPLKVSTLSEVIAVLGEPDLHWAGIEVAFDILREAVQEANNLVHQLSDYIEASIEWGGN